MPQLRRPLFPSGATVISAVLSFCRTDDTVTYFHCDMPVFSHGKDDRAAFRLITAQLHITSGVKQVDLAQAFGISNITVKRAVKLYRSSGAAGFFAERISRGATVLTEPVMQQAQSQLDAGLAPRTVAILLAIKPDTLMKAIRAGRLRILVKKTTKTAHSPALKQTSPTSPAKVIAQSKTAAPPWGEVRAMLSLE